MPYRYVQVKKVFFFFFQLFWSENGNFLPPYFNSEKERQMFKGRSENLVGKITCVVYRKGKSAYGPCGPSGRRSTPIFVA